MLWLSVPFSARRKRSLGSAGRRGALPAVRAGGGADDGEAGGVIRYNESRCNHEKSLPRGGRWAGEAGSDEGHLPNGIGRAPTQPRLTQYHRSNPFAKQNSMRAAASLRST